MSESSFVNPKEIQNKEISISESLIKSYINFAYDEDKKNLDRVLELIPEMKFQEIPERISVENQKRDMIKPLKKQIGNEVSKKYKSLPKTEKPNIQQEINEKLNAELADYLKEALINKNVEDVEKVGLFILSEEELKSLEKLQKNIDEYIPINEMLNKLEIKNIVSIDDGWNQDRYTTDKDLKCFVEEIEDEDKRYKIKTSLDNEEINNLNEFFERMSSLDIEETSREYLEYLRDFINSKKEDKNALEKHLEVLEQLLKNLKFTNKNIKIYKESKKFNKNEEKEYFKGRTLYILDKNMGGNDDDVIADSIFDIDQNSTTKNLVLIYSSELGEDLVNHSNKLKYVQKINTNDPKKAIELLYQLWGINKTYSYGELCDKFVNALYDSAYGKALYETLNIREEIIKEVFEYVKSINLDEMKFGFKESFIEGETIITEFSKIIDSLYNKILLEKHLANISNSHKVLLSFEKRKIEQEKFLEQIQTGKLKYDTLREEIVSSKVKYIKDTQEQYRIADYSINNLYKDISTGDIVVFNGYKEDNIQFGMVITKECDCVIRLSDTCSNPKRKSDKFNILLFEQEKISKDMKVNKDYSNNYIYPIEYKEELYSLKPVSNIKVLDSLILDLCSLNNEGKAKKTYEEKFKEYKSYHSEIYFMDEYKESLKNELSKIESILKVQIEGYGDINKDLVERIRNNMIGINYDIKYDGKEFDIIRICRLNSKKTLQVIQKHIHSTSSIGVETSMNTRVN